jgi:hypothetical protein
LKTNKQRKKNKNSQHYTKAALKFGSEALVLKEKEEQRLEVARIKFLGRLHGITKLDKEKNQCIKEKMGAENILKEIK